jgi:type II secretory pathway pseudopilin PulG
MKSSSHRRRAPHAESGYILLLMVCFAALLTIAAMAVAPSVLLEGRRQREKELIWRGQQYARGIKLYYRKLGHFPTSIDDLTKLKTGSIRFMRAAYKDPVNKQDGSWRLIYVGANGQLIGSLKPPQNLQIPGAPGFGNPAASVAAASSGLTAGSSTPGPGSASNQSGFGSSSSFGSSFGSSSNSSAQRPDPNADPMANLQGDALAETPTIVGGNIIGVGSKIDEKSIIVFDKAKNYRLFEFIWNPANDVANAVQQLNAPGSGGIGTPVGSQSPFGQTPAAPPASGTGTNASPPPAPTPPQP